MKRLIIASVVFALFAAAAVFAGGPFAVDKVGDSGTAQQWLDNDLVWYLDKGNLTETIDNNAAKTWVNDALNKWTGASLHDKDRNYVKTVDVKATFVRVMSDDINTFSEYQSVASREEGPTVIVLDKDGTITRSIAGDAAEGIPGLTEILLSDSTGKKILKGVVILNGKLLSGGSITLSQKQFKAAVLHELGHLFNLDHTQVNLDVADACDLVLQDDTDPSCPDAQLIPTMFPGLKTYRQGSELKLDDVITISWIYPSSAFQSSFCSITGEIQDKNGRPMQGVNVIAKLVSSDETASRVDSRSMVSGALFPACTTNGTYYLHGIVPGRTYEVFYEPLSSEYTGMSGFEPLANPPSGFDTATIGTAKCDSGGETVTMDAVKVEGVNFDDLCPPDADTTPTDTGGGGSSCTLIIPK